MSIRNNTVGTTGITPVETEVTRSMKQESRDFSRGRFKTARTSKQQGKISGDLRSQKHRIIL